MNKVITGATVKNYVKAIKLFCEMAANTEVSLCVLWIKYYIGEDNILGARCSELTNQLPTQIPNSRGSLPRRSIILRTYLGEFRPFFGRAVEFICTTPVEGILLELESL